MRDTSAGGTIDGASGPPRLRVLVVDDDELVRRVVTALLVSSGFAVAEAGDGFDALDKIRDRRPDVVLTDLNMPRCTGQQLCQALQNDPATAAIPVLAMTGTPADESHLRALGCRAVLYKPLLPSLGERLRQIVGNRDAGERADRSGA